MPWSLPEEPADLLALAREYPYDAPAHSYLFRDGEAQAPEPEVWDGLDFDERLAVVAHGSNRSPAQLARKFLDKRYGGDSTIPVAYGWLSGYDVVYAAHVARYGAVTSTLYHAPSVRSRIAITWLSHDQLAFMHETERMNYTYGRLPDGCFAPEAGPEPDPLYAYVGNHGALLHDGGPIALAAIEAEGRGWPALWQGEIQQALAELHHPGEELEALLLSRILEPHHRRAFEDRLRAGTAPRALEGFHALERLDGEGT